MLPYRDLIRLSSSIRGGAAGPGTWSGSLESGRSSACPPFPRARARWLLEELGIRALPVVLCAIAAYAAWRSLRRVLARRALRAVRTITVDQLAAMMDRAEPLTVVDVRSAAALSLVRIPGAVHAPLAGRGFCDSMSLAQRRRIVTYCDCPGQISAARAAHELARSGHDVYA